MFATALHGRRGDSTFVGLNDACCTPSPETSRVMDGLLIRLRENLIDFINVDNPTLLCVVVAFLQQFLGEYSRRLPHVTSFGWRGRIRHSEAAHQQARSVSASSVFTGTGRSISRMLLLPLDAIVVSPYADALAGYRPPLPALFACSGRQRNRRWCNFMRRRQRTTFTVGNFFNFFANNVVTANRRIRRRYTRMDRQSACALHAGFCPQNSTTICPSHLCVYLS